MQFLGLLSFECFIKSVIAKQCEGSRIKRMCIFHVLMVRGLPGSEGLLGNVEAPLATHLVHIYTLHIIIIVKHQNTAILCKQIIDLKLTIQQC